MNTFTIIALCLAAVLGAASIAESATDYCDKSLCYWGTHIACRHNNQFHSRCPRDAKLVQITSELKQFILQLHNEKRNLVAGGGTPRHNSACRMSTMEWDDELAKLAALNVKQCDLKHDECHNTKSFQWSGQNLAYESFFTTADHEEILRAVVDGWYSEHQYSSMSVINKFPKGYNGKTITHFTALAAQTNNRVGCAIATYTEAGNQYHTYLVACNMATTTMETEAVYESCRISASKCASGKNSQYPNLCNTSEKY